MDTLNRQSFRRLLYSINSRPSVSKHCFYSLILYIHVLHSRTKVTGLFGDDNKPWGACCQHFHICWSLLSLYLRWIKEGLWQGRRITVCTLALSLARREHEVHMAATSLVCVHFQMKENLGQQVRLGLLKGILTTVHWCNYLHELFISLEPLSFWFSDYTGDVIFSEM